MMTMMYYFRWWAQVYNCDGSFNLMKENGKAAYLDSGNWAANAIKEAKKLGTVDVIGSSRKKIILTFQKLKK